MRSYFRLSARPLAGGRSSPPISILRRNTDAPVVLLSSDTSTSPPSAVTIEMVCAPLLGARCTGTTRITQPKADGGIAVVNSPDTQNATFVFRRDLGWLFDQRTRVLDVKR